jgi:hypothetical protein
MPVNGGFPALTPLTALTTWTIKPSVLVLEETEMGTPVDVLLQIMQDDEISTRRRIQAAEAILSHESPPEAVTSAQQYLEKVYDDKEQDLEWRINAIEVSRKYATPRVTTTVVHIEDQKAYIEKARRDAIFRRRKYLIFKGITPPDFPRDWCSDLKEPDWIPPTPQEVQEEEEELRELAEESANRPSEPIHVPGPGEFDTAS